MSNSVLVQDGTRLNSHHSKDMKELEFSVFILDFALLLQCKIRDKYREFQPVDVSMKYLG